VAPYEWLRQEFKERIGLDNFEEFYVHCSEERERDHFHSKDYVSPQKDFFDVDTTKDNPKQSFTKIVSYLRDKEKL
jgi:adenylylsulfate kinase-like enzyme